MQLSFGVGVIVAALVVVACSSWIYIRKDMATHPESLKLTWGHEGAHGLRRGLSQPVVDFLKRRGETSLHAEPDYIATEIASPCMN
jgi:hypothetical protein